MEWIGYLAALAAAVWVYRDAKSRDSSAPWLWALSVLAIVIIFLPLYLLFRPKRLIVTPCPYCEKPVKGNPPFCPSCGEIIKTKS